MKLWIMAMLLALTAPLITTIAEKEVFEMETLTISSTAFSHGEAIPARYTCDGTDASPPITIRKIPPAARSLALVMDDPDAPAGMWVHWVVWNIPVQTREIPESALPLGANQGKNDWKRNNYGGPCPPSGIHRYFFKVYALDTLLKLDSSASKDDLERAMAGHILAKGEMMGTYHKR